MYCLFIVFEMLQELCSLVHERQDGSGEQRDTESMERSIKASGVRAVLTFHGERFCIFPNFVKG